MIALLHTRAMFRSRALKKGTGYCQGLKII